jgi:hypothetical protein
MAFHPQTNGQMKRINGVLNQYLKNYVNVDKKVWGERLGMAKFCYNSIMHLTTKMSLFNIGKKKPRSQWT